MYSCCISDDDDDDNVAREKAKYKNIPLRALFPLTFFSAIGKT